MNRSPNFDRIARYYRWLEYLTLGRALGRCRLHFLPQLASCTHALVLGDGDGRFLARLLAANSHLVADAVDTSGAMLALLRNRCAFAADRVITHHADAIAFTQRPKADSPRYDLVATHFFLDCLSQSQVDELAAVLAPQLTPGSPWLFSDFRIPLGPMCIPARILIGILYLAFRILTGLRPTRLPDHAAALTRSGFVRIALHRSLFGILTTELWSISSPSLAPSVRITT